MARLSDTQTMLLSAASTRENCSLMPAPAALKATGKVLERSLMALVRRELVAEAEVGDDMAVWRQTEDGTRIGLVITAAGLAAIGIDASDEGAASGTASGDGEGIPCRPRGKLGDVLAAIEAPGGATLAELAGSAAWQPHTTRAALTRLRQRGLDIRLETVGERRAYRIRGAGRKCPRRESKAT